MKVFPFIWLTESKNNTLPKCRNVPFPSSCFYSNRYTINSSCIAFLYTRHRYYRNKYCIKELSGTVLLAIYTDLFQSNRKISNFLRFLFRSVSGYSFNWLFSQFKKLSGWTSKVLVFLKYKRKMMCSKFFAIRLNIINQTSLIFENNFNRYCNVSQTF